MKCSSEVHCSNFGSLLSEKKKRSKYLSICGFHGIKMSSLLLRRSKPVTKMFDYNLVSTLFGHSSSFSSYAEHGDESKQLFSSNDKRVASRTGISDLHLTPLTNGRAARSGNCGIELVDADIWQISTGLVEAWKGRNGNLETDNACAELVDENISVAGDDSDFDEIDDMRVRGKLFYKIDRDSKEYEEYSFDFHRRKKSTSNNDRKASQNERSPDTSKLKEVPKVAKKKQSQGSNFDFMLENLISSNYEMGRVSNGKVVKTPTFNQLTAPYHEPFCLDIYVSKGSVRACIVHRATSKVVAVAHSISKDMKFDYSSKRNSTTCAAVGGLLAQRALADDIHNVVYTPRKGDKVEGKLQIVLQSIIDNGVTVKVKIKQRNVKRVGRFPPR